MFELYTDPKNFLKPQFHIAVVEASNNKTKTGFYTYAALKQAGYSVTAVNPLETRIQGDACFPGLRQLHPFPDVVILTISEAEQKGIGLKIIQEMQNTAIFRLWVEPGCETEELKRFATENNIELLTGFSVRTELARQNKGEKPQS